MGKCRYILIPRRESAKTESVWGSLSILCFNKVVVKELILTLSILDLKYAFLKSCNCFIPRTESAKAEGVWGPFEYLIFY